ncbi:acyl-CoA carboxylase subunit epsilon [Arthrobacter sp. TmT3-37]
MTARDGTPDGVTGESPALLSVVAGRPTEEELAALTAVVVALQGVGDADGAPDHGRSWVRRAMLRLGPTPGPGSWRRSVR